MKFIETWKSYVSYPDEREEAESNRINKRAFFILVFANLLLAYFLMNLSQVASVHQVDAPQYDAMGTIAFVLCIMVAVACFYSAGAQARRGITGTTYFADADRFPIGFGLAISASAAAGFCALLYILRCLAEVMLVGPAETFWISNLAIAVFFFGILFVCIYIGIYAFYSSAKKKQNELLAELED